MAGEPVRERLRLEADDRTRLWDAVAEEIERYLGSVSAGRVTPELNPARIQAWLAEFDFDRPMEPVDALKRLSAGLSRYQTHTPHRRYFGLFNPSPTTMGIAADALVAAFNPQLASWSHSPLAIEIENHLIRSLGRMFGYEPAATDGTFCSGGAEANHTAVLTALAAAFPEYAQGGTRALSGQPVMYVSAESHHSFLKAARMTGIGQQAVREIPVGPDLRMRVAELEAAIQRDREAGDVPFLAVGTAGTTNAGAIDPLGECARVAASEGLWFHADAAWGGAAALLPEMRGLLAGIEAADSITFDAHKFLSVPMGAGVFLTRRAGSMDRAFRTETSYMPREAKGLDVMDPHLHSMQWSRRFTGAKLFLTLAVAGWDGYAERIRHQTRMGTLMRERLSAAGWRLENDSPLPVVCFTDPGGADPHAVAMDVVASGEAWISTTVLGGRRRVLRACVTNFETGEHDIDALVETLARSRRKLGSMTAAG